MRTVKISKEKLLDKLKANRNDHRAIFEEALDGWKTRVLNELEHAVEDAQIGKKYRTYFDLPIPEDHTPDYDDIIERVEWHEEDVIELDLLEFSKYVRDQWAWMPDFIGSASSYSSSSSSANLLLKRKSALYKNTEDDFSWEKE